MSDDNNITAYKLQLKERILDTAMQAFIAHGIRAVKMDDISQELGISKRTLYELYDNKEDLLYAGVVKRRGRQEQEMLRLASQGHNVMSILLHVYKKKVEELKMVAPQFYEDLEKYPRVMELLAESHRHNRTRMMQFLHKGVDEGYFRQDVDYIIVAELFDAIGNHIMTQQLYKHYNIELLFRNLVFISLRGICTQKGVKALDDSLMKV